MRLISEILLAFGNFSTENKSYSLLLTQCTSIIESMQKMVEKCKDLPQDTLSHVVWICKNLSNVKLSKLQVYTLINMVEKLTLNAQLDQQLHDILSTGNNLINGN